MNSLRHKGRPFVLRRITSEEKRVDHWVSDSSNLVQEMTRKRHWRIQRFKHWWSRTPRKRGTTSRIARWSQSFRSRLPFGHLAHDQKFCVIVLTASLGLRDFQPSSSPQRCWRRRNGAYRPLNMRAKPQQYPGQEKSSR